MELFFPIVQQELTAPVLVDPVQMPKNSFSLEN